MNRLHSLALTGRGNTFVLLGILTFFDPILQKNY